MSSQQGLSEEHEEVPPNVNRLAPEVEEEFDVSMENITESEVQNEINDLAEKVPLPLISAISDMNLNKQPSHTSATSDEEEEEEYSPFETTNPNAKVEPGHDEVEPEPEAEESGEVEFSVKTPAGKDYTLTLHIDCTVLEIKQTLAKMSDVAIEAAEMKLIFKAKPLSNNNQTIREAGIKQGDRLHMIRQLLGADEAQKTFVGQKKVGANIEVSPLNERNVIYITIPQNAKPGNRLVLQPPGRGRMFVYVPAGHVAGDRLRVQLPDEEPSLNNLDANNSTRSTASNNNIANNSLSSRFNVFSKKPKPAASSLLNPNSDSNNTVLTLSSNSNLNNNMANAVATNIQTLSTANNSDLSTNNIINNNNNLNRNNVNVVGPGVLLKAVVPENTLSGSEIVVNVPTRGRMKVQLPGGVRAGDTFYFRVLPDVR